ncbi:MAG: hypothetical protein ABI882_01835, partial [Acidobacteriota bacterium]
MADSKVNVKVAPVATQGIEAVEIKVTMRPDQELQALRALKLDEDSAEIRIIFFYDTPKLTLFKAGIVLRARLVKGDADDTTVKIRPVIPQAVGEGWKRVAGFKVEADRTGERVVCSASLTQMRKRSEIDAAAEGRRSIEKLFSKDQMRLVAESSAKPIDFAALQVMGPIRVLCWTTVHKGFKHKLTSEEWRLPDGEDLLEVSIKVKPADAAKAQEEFENHLRGLGLDPHGAQ